MRDDTITVQGPFEVADLFVPEREDEEEGLIPAHTLDMSAMRRVEFSSRACPCGRLHGYVIVLHWDDVLGWPELAEHALEAGAIALLRSMQDCQDVEAIAREMGR